jgi:tRNA (cytidine/uridine-2'-O-)-methyltransferase
MLHVVLFQPEIAPNTGNIGRMCALMRSRLHLIHPLGYVINDRNLRRAGMDYWAHLDWEAVENWQELVRRLGESRFWFFSKTAQRSYAEAVYSEGDVLVFGSESQGLPPSLLEAHPEHCLRIPMHANARSLNLSVSVAVAAYEAKRQCEKNI